MFFLSLIEPPIKEEKMHSSFNALQDFHSMKKLPTPLSAVHHILTFISTLTCNDN